MAATKTNGVATKAKAKTAAAPKAKAPAAKKAVKRAAPKDEPEDEEDAPKAKRAKVPEKKPIAKATAKAPRKVSATAKKAKTPEVPESQKDETAEEPEEAEEAAVKEPTPAPAPKPAEKFFTPQKGVKTHPKIPVHKIGPKLNDVPSEKLDIYVFGEGSSGELGLGSKKDANGRKPIDVQRPRLNPFLAKLGVVHIAVGGMHCAAITADNQIVTWGVNDQGALGRDTKWDGGLKDMADGDDSDSDSDSGEMNPLETTPTAIDSKWFAEGAKFTQLVASDSATYALTEDGAVYGWGTFRSNDGILGFSETKLVQWYPVLVPELKKIVTMAAGSNHILAINNKGRAYAWGSGQQNQLGRRVVERSRLTGLVPREFGLRGKIAKVACGSYHSFAIDQAGAVWAWGLNSYGETGINEDLGEDNSSLPKPAIVESLRNFEVTEISGGGHHSIACTKDGKALVWGRCDGAQLGIALDQIPEEDLVKDEHGRPRIVKNPIQVKAIEACVSVDAGSDNSFAVTSDGKAYAWGFNANYQTGLGGDDDVDEATVIANSAVKDKQIIAALSGGQFGVLVGKS